MSHHIPADAKKKAIVVEATLPSEHEPRHSPRFVEIPIHPAAKLLPEMTGEEYAALKADIAANGIRQNIVLFHGQLLDGRHRQRAMLELGFDPAAHCRELEEPCADPVTFVVSLNLHRRHLTTSQRAIIAAELSTLKRGETAKRKKAKGQICTSTITEAAELLDVSPRSVKTAKKVLEECEPEVIDRVRKGALSVSSAKSKGMARQSKNTAKRDGENATTAELLRWAARRREPTTKAALSDHFGLSQSECAKQLALIAEANAARLLVTDIGDGRYRVTKAAMVPISDDDKSFADLWKEIRMMAEYGLKQIHDAESGGWSRAHQMKFLGSVLAMAKEYA